MGAKCDGCGKFVKWATAKVLCESSDLDGKRVVYDVRCAKCAATPKGGATS